MPQGFSGISTDTPNNLVLDAGVAYANISITDLEATGWADAINVVNAPNVINLGATRGGASFNVNRTLREVEVNGALGPVDSLIRRQEVRPTLSAQLIEMTTANLQQAISGAVVSQVPVAPATAIYDVISGGEISPSAFLENIVLATRLQGATADSPIVFVLFNAMVHSSPDMSAEDENEMGIEVEFVGHFDLATPQDESSVWRIYRPIVV